MDQGWDVVKSGVAGMTEQTEKYMGTAGGEGILDKKARLKTEALDLSEQKTMLGLDDQLSKNQTAAYSLGNQADQALSKGGFATSGQVQKTIDMQKQSLIEQGQSAWAGTGIAMEGIGIQKEEVATQLEQDKVDFMKKIKDDYNNLLMSYQSATGEAYGKGENIDSLLEEYDS